MLAFRLYYMCMYTYVYVYIYIYIYYHFIFIITCVNLLLATFQHTRKILFEFYEN